MENFNRVLARAITHYAYRNTKIEDLHADGVRLSLKIYRDVYKFVYQRMQRVQRYTKYILKFARDERNGKNDPAVAFDSIADEDKFGFVSYYKNIQHNSIYGRMWDEAELVEVKTDGSLARYILDGEFKKHCIEGLVLDDVAMKKINKDVHSRVYSLIAGGYLS